MFGGTISMSSEPGRTDLTMKTAAACGATGSHIATCGNDLIPAVAAEEPMGMATCTAVIEAHPDQAAEA